MLCQDEKMGRRHQMHKMVASMQRGAGYADAVSTLRRHLTQRCQCNGVRRKSERGYVYSYMYPPPGRSEDSRIYHLPSLSIYRIL